MTYHKALVLLVLFLLSIGLALIGHPLTKYSNLRLRLTGYLCLIASILISLLAVFSLVSVLLVTGDYR